MSIIDVSAPRQNDLVTKILTQKRSFVDLAVYLPPVMATEEVLQLFGKSPEIFSCSAKWSPNCPLPGTYKCASCYQMYCVRHTTEWNKKTSHQDIYCDNCHRSRADCSLTLRAILVILILLAISLFFIVKST
jgi:hypothetical protein